MKTLWFQILCFVLIVPPLWARGVPRVVQMPVVRTVAPEDAPLLVRVEASGVQTYLWQHQQKILCKKAQCRLETSSWTKGRHNVLVILQNSSGRLQFQFAVDVVERGFDQPIKPVNVELTSVTVKRIHTFVNKGSTASVRQGRGFITLDDRVSLLESTGQLVSWEGERLHASGGGLFHIKAPQEEHFSFPGTILFLRKYQSQRYIELERGWVRSRAFSKSPQFQILAGRFHILPGAHSDVLVSVRDHGDVDVAVIRGMVRIHWFDDESETEIEGEAGENFVLPYHHHGVFREKDPGQPLVKKFSSATVSQLVATSTPGVLTVEPDENDYRFVRAVKGYRKALAKVKKSPQDSMANLQILMPFIWNDRAKDEMIFEVARASQQLGLNEQAFALYEELDEQTEASYWVGLIHLSQGSYGNAVEMFEVAEDQDPGFEMQPYYQGVAEYHTGDIRSAQVRFQKFLWSHEEGPLAESSHEFLQDIYQDIPFEIEIYGHLIRDTQILGVDENVEVSKGITTRQSLGLHAGSRLVIPYVRDWRGYLDWILGSEGIFYFDNQLQTASSLSAYVGAETQFEIGGFRPGENMFLLSFSPRIKTVLVGLSRAVDQLETNWDVELLRWWGQPGWSYRRSQAVDPIPTLDDPIDVVLQEAVAASDRSHVAWEHKVYLHPYQTSTLWLQFYAQRMELEYSSYVVLDDFKDFISGFKGTWRFSPRWRFLFDVWTGQRNFSKKNRDDSRFSVDLKLNFSLHPRWDMNFKIMQLNQNSSASGYSWNRTYLSLGATLRY